MNKVLWSLVFLFPFIFCIDKSCGNETIDEKLAIKLAEEFIAVNGYTQAPADNNKVSRESLEVEYNIWKVLAARRNTLKPHAYGIIKGRKDGKDGWTVVFECTNGDKDRGRAVTMDANGANIRMEHVSIFLDAVEKKLDQPAEQSQGSGDTRKHSFKNTFVVPPFKIKN